MLYLIILFIIDFIAYPTKPTAQMDEQEEKDPVKLVLGEVTASYMEPYALKHVHDNVTRSLVSR